MSHLTRIKTFVRDLSTLQSILTQFSISWEKSNFSLKDYNNETHIIELIIKQPNSFSIGFSFDGNVYELFVDTDFWNQPWPLGTFLNTINVCYLLQSTREDLNTTGFSAALSIESDDDVIDVGSTTCMS